MKKSFYLATFFSAFILFFVLSPGVLLTLPPKGDKFKVVLFHAFVFSILLSLVSMFLKNIMKLREGSETECHKADPNVTGTDNASWYDGECLVVSRLPSGITYDPERSKNPTDGLSAFSGCGSSSVSILNDGKLIQAIANNIVRCGHGNSMNGACRRLKLEGESCNTQVTVNGKQRVRGDGGKCVSGQCQMRSPGNYTCRGNGDGYGGLRSFGICPTDW